MSKDIRTTEGMHHYTESGLDNVWLSGGFEIVASPYGDSLKISDLSGLHKCIAQCLIKKPDALTGHEFRFLRVELDWSQPMAAGVFGVVERTIREWETGDEPVAEPANTLIRFICKQRYEPDANYEKMSIALQQMHALDRELHVLKRELRELRLELKNTRDGWQEESCLKAA
jgi:putative transcriptional regulator